MGRAFVAHWLGRVAFADAQALQEGLLDARIKGKIGDTLLLLEHDPVVTLGRSARHGNVLSSPERLNELQVDIREATRGGDVTYHGPGQLIAYPIFDLSPDRKDVRRYVRDLARVMIALAGTYGVAASFIEGEPKLVGVWVDEASPAHWPGLDGSVRPSKIGAIGVRISRWMTMHGFAFNVSTDLSRFRLIVPCGIEHYGVTSLVALGASSSGVEEAGRRVVRFFEEVFDAKGDVADAALTQSLFDYVPAGP